MKKQLKLLTEMCQQKNSTAKKRVQFYVSSCNFANIDISVLILVVINIDNKIGKKQKNDVICMYTMKESCSTRTLLVFSLLTNLTSYIIHAIDTQAV